MARINCDVDGVVCDFVVGLFDQLRAAGFDIEPVEDPKWNAWDIFTRMEEDARAWSFERLRDSSFWTELPVIAGGQESILTLREAGHHIQWVTTSWEHCLGWHDARRQWLDAHFQHPNQNLSTDLTVTGSKAEVWADAFFEDKPSNLHGWATKWEAAMPSRNRLSYLYRTPHNAHYEKRDFFEELTWTPKNVQDILRSLNKLDT